MYLFLLSSIAILLWAYKDNFISTFKWTGIIILSISIIEITFKIDTRQIMNFFEIINIVVNTALLSIIIYTFSLKIKYKRQFSVQLSLIVFEFILILANIYDTMLPSKFLVGFNFYLSISVISNLISNITLHSPTTEEKFDYILVLGAALRGYELSDLLKDRMEKSFEYYIPNQATMIFSGGISNSLIEESEAMKIFAMKHDILESDIITEAIATTTVENIYYTKKILEEIDPNYSSKKVCVVTNDFHAYRTALICKKEKTNWKVTYSKSDFKTKINTYLVELSACMYLDKNAHAILSVIFAIYFTIV